MKNRFNHYRYLCDDAAKNDEMSTAFMDIQQDARDHGLNVNRASLIFC